MVKLTCLQFFSLVNILELELYTSLQSINLFIKLSRVFLAKLDVANADTVIGVEKD